MFLRARYAPLAVPIAVDVTTGDRITPAAVVYEYPFVFDEGSAKIMAYPLETVLAEKVETVLTRNVATTRIRDFYDVFELWRVKGSQVDVETLGAALKATCEKRNSTAAVSGRSVAIAAMHGDEGLVRQWATYGSSTRMPRASRSERRSMRLRKWRRSRRGLTRGPQQAAVRLRFLRESKLRTSYRFETCAAGCRLRA